MKRNSVFVLVGFIAILLSLPGCDPSNRVDFEKLLSPANLPYIKPGKMMQVTSHDTTGGNNDMIIVRPGKTVTLMNVSGPGVITRIWFRVKSRDPYYLRRILLRMYWDEETDPSVEVPLGDFFGNGFTYKQYSTAYLSMAGGGFTCFFPMPFEKSAKIDIVNETGQEISSFAYQINYMKMDGYLGRDAGYFHAWWNRSIRTDYDSSYTILKTKGSGHIVGVNLNIQSYDGKFSFLEGDEKVYVDGEKKPSLYGTGTEDYFSGGDNFMKGEFIGPYNGLIFKDDSLGRIAAYRFHIIDPIPFRKSIRFTIEHGPNNQDIADYCSTVYWYQLEPHAHMPSLPRSGQRIPFRVVTPNKLLEAENLKFDLGSIHSRTEDMSQYGPEWSNSKQLRIECHEKDEFSIALQGQLEPSYSVNLYYTKGPDYGNIGIYQGDKKVAEIHGFYHMIYPGGKVVIPAVSETGHKLELKFVLEGKDPLSSGYTAGFDGFEIAPNRSYIKEWYVIGPFPNTGLTRKEKAGIDSVFTPEEAVDLKEPTPGINGKFIHWIKYPARDNGYFDLTRLIFPHDNVISYVVTYLYATRAEEVSLMVGSTGGIKVIFNNREVFHYMGVRLARPDQAEVKLKVLPGWNKLLLKLENKDGGYGFYARLRENDNSIIITPDQVSPAKMKK